MKKQPRITNPKVACVQKWFAEQGLLLAHNTHTGRTELWEYDYEKKKAIRKLNSNYRSVEGLYRAQSTHRLSYYNKKDELVEVKMYPSKWTDYCVQIALQYQYNPVTQAYKAIESVKPATSGSLLRTAFKLDYEVFAKAMIPQDRAEAYIDALSQLLLANMYRRNTDYGSEVHIAPILYSEKGGIGKSHFVKSISPCPDLVVQGVSGKLLGLSDTAVIGRKVYGMLVAELGELHLRNADLDIVKANITANEYHFSFKFRDDDNYPLSHIFIGTTNRDKFLLKDESGYRRFPIAPLCGHDDIAKAIEQMHAQRDSYIKQAMLAVENGEIGCTGEFTCEEFVDYQQRLGSLFAWNKNQNADDLADEIGYWLTRHNMWGKKWVQQLFVDEHCNGYKYWNQITWKMACEILEIKESGRLGGRRAWLAPERVEH